ncbi:hypothetical protein VTK73DRAFT_2092 [Phialemonium thermophilum]|uniref:Uncharacterized protein n=1 Tax=Phialemonium thermophilum TaxID=223376 RepID=A0ABR3X615_9PEZI
MSSASSVAWESDGPPPPYQEKADGHAPSRSSASPSAFAPTCQLQIEAIGYDFDQALIGKTFENIPVHRVDTGELEYLSLRLKKSSNSCALVRGSDPDRTPLIATLYCWGPGRPPKMRILPRATSLTVEEAIHSDHVECELVDVRSRSLFSRTQRFDTSFGKFEWRYGGGSERAEAYDAASLLVMERIDLSSSAGGMKGKRGIRVAQLVRNDEFRTPGTTRYMGGNGGRLMMDLSSWSDGKSAAIRDVEAFVVASCICMLKREGDRFQDNQIAAVS